jgi:hypothetical protein
MVNTRSEGGQDVSPVVRAHIANQQNLVPPPPPNPAMDPATQQFFTAQIVGVLDRQPTTGSTRSR